MQREVDCDFHPADRRDRTAQAAGGVDLHHVAFASPWSVVAITSTLVVVAIALGPVLGLVPIAVFAVVWAVSIVYFVIVTLARHIRALSGWHWLFIVGVGFTVVRACALGIVQLLEHRPSLFWNVDMRYYTGLAQSIARFGGIGDSTDYAGERLEYHAAQAWIAGALDHVLGIPINVSMLVIVPALSVVLLAVGAYRFLRALGLPIVPSLVAVIVGLNANGSPLDFARAVLRADRRSVVVSAVWPEASTLSIIAFSLAIGFTAAWVLISADRWSVRFLGGACLAGLVVLKPQYFVGFGAVSAALVVLRNVRGPARVSWLRLTAWAVGIAALAVFFSRLNPEKNLFSGLDVALMDGIRAVVRSGSQPFGVAILTISMIVVAVILLVPAFASRVVESAGGRKDLIWACGAVLAVAIGLAFVLGATTFLISEELLGQARAAGLEMSREFHDLNLNQILVPISLLVVMLAAGLVTVLLRSSRSVLRFVPAVVVVLVTLAPLPAVAEKMRNPTGSYAYEWTEEQSLLDLIEGVDETKGLWISSDLADSAEDFARPLRAVNVNALSGAQFYVSNVEYVGWTRSDVAQRIDNLQRFFGTEWSPWHDRFVERRGIRFVIVRDRCPPNWTPSDFPGSVVGTRGDWTLLKVGEREQATAASPWPAFREEPGYGRSACLSGKTVP